MAADTAEYSSNKYSGQTHFISVQRSDGVFFLETD
jgi:hypothetical protein